MSDSILYLAIVAIWAVFLVPAWVRRPHASKSEEYVGEYAETSEWEAETDLGPAPRGAMGAAPGNATVDIEGDVGPGRGAEPTPMRPAPGPSQGRLQMMRARRRILTILTALVFITAGFVATGYVKWWICVPPVGLLVLYVLLLREIAMAEAELASKRAAWEARSARDVWRRAHQAWEAGREAAAQQTAEVIDISRRVGDQLYDQYADAAVRAVGD